MKVPSAKKFGTRSASSVPKAKNKGFVQRTFSPPRMIQPRPPGMVQRPKKYTKDQLQTDPLQFANIGFGRTGLTGES